MNAKTKMLSLMLCLMVIVGSVRASDNLDRHIDVINKTPLVMYRLYASNVDQDSWGEDLLGNDVLPPGYWSRFNIDDGSGYCLYDFKAVFSGGIKVER